MEDHCEDYTLRRLLFFLFMAAVVIQGTTNPPRVLEATKKETEMGRSME